MSDVGSHPNADVHHVLYVICTSLCITELSDVLKPTLKVGLRFKPTPDVVISAPITIPWLQIALLLSLFHKPIIFYQQNSTTWRQDFLGIWLSLSFTSAYFENSFQEVRTMQIWISFVHAGFHLFICSFRLDSTRLLCCICVFWKQLSGNPNCANLNLLQNIKVPHKQGFYLHVTQFTLANISTGATHSIKNARRKSDVNRD